MKNLSFLIHRGLAANERAVWSLAGVGLRLMPGLVLSLPASVQAAMPTIDPPSHSNAGTGLMGTLVGYFFDGIYWFGVIVAGVALVAIATMFIGKLSQVHHGKATWGELGAIATAGVACIVGIIWLVTKANETVATGAAGADAG